ncbi:MAG: hypothetical protein OXF72_11050 [Gammaproteobacteria bacterium]|nr:hypothetical protein [Gammaproteobacteria bacterium]MCY4198958.1 hypothetical protein [Gammaproteobacteria bacterium]MCY4278379.1 hypothetical protein [Gammaproteobacteria bacterium]MCY4323879.1 hypothetical protein [Gammaproteobacteria bacterium]
MKIRTSDTIGIHFLEERTGMNVLLGHVSGLRLKYTDKYKELIA